ncbi:AGAP003468-PA-like protein [Anopheles sinensis]|uniref:AGAP003468-PA-like protein n=1 Tax=Anopheles sinensis TaxID=74873 RepID=A0A084WMB1_ANOSI|nr:AGAP003468-PA-like protein [Anopheles sinensis]
MKRSVQSVGEPAGPGNIGSYGIFGGNGGHTNTNNQRRNPRRYSETLVLLILALWLGVTSATTVVTPASVADIELPASTQSTTVEALLDTNSTTARAASKPMFSTGNRLWDALIADCMRKPTFACIQKNVYSFLGEQLEVENMNFTNRVQFLKNRVDFTKYTREANEEDSEDDNEIPDARGAFEQTSPIEEVTTALREKSLKFMLTHDVNVQLPEIMFDGAVFRIQPRAIEGNGMIAKLEFVPRTEIAEARGNGSPRILFKKIKKFFQNKLLLAFLAIVLIIKIIKIKVMWLLPLLVGVGTAKKLVLKFLLFLFPALAHIFKLCSYYHASYHKPNFHHHQHHINHLHTFYPHDHAGPELIYTKPPRGHPSEYLHGAPVPPHTHYQPEVNYEFTAPGLGSEFISDRNSNVETSFKPKYDDLNDIRAWGLGESTNTSAPQSSPYFTSPPASPSGGSGIGSYNVNPLTTAQHGARRVTNPKPVYGPPGYTAPSLQKRIPTGAASSIASQYVSAPSGPTLSAEEQIVSTTTIKGTFASFRCQISPADVESPRR